MCTKIKLLFVVIVTLASSMAQANYPGFNAGAICNNYKNFTGIVTKLASATTYDGYEDTWVEVTSTKGEKEGGKIYYRDPVESGYKPMLYSLRNSLVTGLPVTICVNRDTIYAVELGR